MQDGAKTISTVAKKRLVLGVVAVVLLAVAWWAYNTSSISVVDQNYKSDTSVDYSVFAGDKKAGSQTLKVGSFNIQVGRGGYKVSVRQGETSYLAYVKTQGWFKKTVVEAKLKPEDNRTYVGNNPAGCSWYLKNVLVSYACGDLYQNINIHVPATNSTPTYISRRRDSAINGYVHGFINYKGEDLVLIDNQSVGEAPAYYSLDEVSSDLSLVRENRLASLNPADSYAIKGFMGGFVVYDSSYNNIYYYSDIGSQPHKINVGRPKDSRLNPTNLDVHGSSIAALFSSAKDNRSEVIINAEGKNQDVSLSSGYSSVNLCGNELCLLGSKGLGVYKVSGSHAKLGWLLPDVKKMVETDRGLVVVDGSGVIGLNTDDMSGFYEYTFGDFSFDGIQAVNAGYILDLSNNKGNKVALFIDEGVADMTGAIDKEIEQLQKIPQIKSLSVYSNYIYVSPNLGQLSYQQSSGIYDYNPATKKAVSEQINQAVSKSGIDTKAYKIINPYNN